MKETVSVNPYTGKVIQTYKNHSLQEVNKFVEAADQRFYSWRDTPFSTRKKRMLAVAAELKKNKEIYAKTITEEMGKPIVQAVQEVEKCAWVCEYYAEQAEKQLQDEVIQTEAFKSYVKFEPLGVILAIMPWNFPFWQVFRFAAPALMAGNTVLLKHASNVFGCALHLEKIFENAGFPSGCFTTLLIGSSEVEPVLKHEKVRAATLTGSGPAGSAVASVAGREIKKTVLELGGSNGLIVMEDCDLEKTVKICIQARFQNTGQSCISGKRLIIDRKIVSDFLNKMKEELKNFKSGDPADPDTFFGTLAREDLAVDLEEQVRESIEMGAVCILGGSRRGAYFEPTILTGVTAEMPVFKEETFGPVLSVTTFETLEEAVELSNNSRYGLGVSIFTQNLETAEKMTGLFEEGAVFINELVKSDPRLPFGGIKQSGYGRELSSYGIQEFINRKTIYINKF